MDVRILCTRSAASVLLAVLLAAGSGCRAIQEYWSPTREGLDPDEISGKTSEAKTDAAAEEPAADAAKPDAKSEAPRETTGPDAALLNALAKDAWSLNVVMAGAKAEATFRWRNPALDPTLRLPAEKRPDLTALCDDKDPITAANAAIILARWEQPTSIARLAVTVRNAELRLPVRRAALEALGQLSTPSPASALQGLLKEYGEFAGPAARTYVAELHADLLPALARHAKVGLQPYWIAALKSPDPLVRVAALRAWCSATDLDLPAVAVELRNDADSRVRCAALHTLAQHGHPAAHDHLRRALDDYDLDVRLAAISALGELGSDAARASLEKIRQHPGEVVRMAAVEALAAAGADAAVAASVADTSWRVRQAVAEAIGRNSALATRNPREATRLISQLMTDRNPQVQQAAISAVADWPLEQAGPALFLALGDGGYLVRKRAAMQLTERWAPAADYPVDGSADNRAAAIERLQSQWTAQFGNVAHGTLLASAEAPRAALTRIESQFRKQVATTADAPGNASEAPADAAASPVDVDAVRDLVAQLNAPTVAKSARRAAVQSLRQMGAPAVPALEQLATDEKQHLADEIFSEVLPQVNATFAALDQLRSAEAHERWLAGDKLAVSATNRALSPLALERLAAVMAAQKDPMVWQSVLAAVARDGREPAVRMAYMAVGNDAAEVRRRACEYLDQHPDAKHAPALLPLLEDEQSSVVIAAARALGSGGAIDDPAPLAALLTRSDKQVRLAAATSLTRLRASEGVAALERLAADADADIRRHSATAMGRLADPVFVPTLVTLLDDRHDIARAALDSLTAIVGRDVAAQRPDDDSPPTVAERIRRWQHWYHDTQEAPGSP